MTRHFCDICGREIDTVKSTPILISFNGFYKNERIYCRRTGKYFN